MQQCTFCNSTPTIPSKSWYFDGYSNICYKCALERTDISNLNEVDRLFQHLNIAFFPNDWIKLWRREEPLAALQKYVAQYNDSFHHKPDWKEQTALLTELIETGTINLEVEALKPHTERKLQRKWGTQLPLDQVIKMEENYNLYLKDYAPRKHQEKELLKKLATISVLIDAKLEAGINDKDLLDSYKKLLSLISTTVSEEQGDSVTTVSELIAFIQKNGFKPNYVNNVARDELDLLKKNLHEHVLTLVGNDPTILTKLEKAVDKINDAKES